MPTERKTITIPRSIHMMVLRGDSAIDPEDTDFEIAAARCIRDTLDRLGWKAESDVPGSEHDESVHYSTGNVDLLDLTIVRKVEK